MVACIFSNLLISLLISVLLILIFFWVKIEITYKQHIRIINAIHGSYEEGLITFNEAMRMYEKMEDYDSTLLRVYDFGYSRILPSEDLEKIEKRIK